MLVVEVDVAPFGGVVRIADTFATGERARDIAFVTNGVVGIPVPEMSESFNSDKVGLGEV